MPNQRSNPNFLILIGIAIVALLLGIYSGRRPSTPAPRPAAESAAARPDTVSAAAPDDRTPEAALLRFLDRLRHGPINPGDLDAFRAALLAADPGLALRAIRGFLATGQDALTGEHFSIGPNGELSGAPTLRVLLLDMMGRIARAHDLPDAGDVSRKVLDKKTTADEWAVALRNVGWATPKDRDFLAAKARDLIEYQPWRQQRAPGYYEAFDVIVYTQDVGFISQLGQFVSGEDEPLKNTAAATLDRLSAMAPLDVMSFLNTNPAELSDKPFLRSDFYTKADFTQPAQRAAVEAYLDRPDVSAKAKEKVIAALGAPNLFVSDNLLTSTTPPGGEGEPLIPAAQKAALDRAFNDWLTTKRYPSLGLSIMTRQLDLKQ